MIVRTRRLVASGFAALALTAVATGCGSQTDTSAPVDAATVETPRESTADPSPTPSGASAPASPAASPGEAAAGEQTQQAAAPQSTTTADRLLTAGEVPGFNDQFTWATASTRMREGNPFGTCHKYAMTSIGATKVAVRTFAPVQQGSDATASHLVAEFADEMTAKRAFEVLKSWREKCAEELRGYDRADVGRLQAVSAGAAGGWYLLTYGPAGGDPDASYFDAQGLTRVGSRVSVLEMRLVGQDYNYPAGEEPMVAAVVRSGEKLA